MSVASHARQLGAVVSVVFGNRDLRRCEIAFFAFNGAEWAVWLAMLVYAYEQGGATTAGIVALVQLVPATLFAPVAAVLADRYRPARVLLFAYLTQVAGMFATATALLLDGPPWLAYGCAAFTTTAITLTRPTMAALTPALCRAPDELTAANVVQGWGESVGALAAPIVAGVILALAGPGWVFVVMGAVLLGGALRVRDVAGPAAGSNRATGVRAELSVGFSAVLREPAARTLVGLLGAEFVALGMVDVLYVVLAFDALGMGEGGAGYLNAAFGAGGAVGIAVTASLVGRARLMPAVVVSLAVWGAAFGVMAVWSTAAGALVLLAAAGVARSLFDVAGRTLLQRTAPPDVLARVFGVLEGLTMACLAVGSLLVPLLIALGGTKAAVLGTGALLPLLALMTGRRLFALDATAHVPIVEIGLLRSLRLFAALPPPEIEGLARSLESVEAGAGTAIVTQGEDGDRYYAIADGDLEVTVDGHRTATLSRGDGFGEIALLRNVPRTATVAALTPVRLYALAKEPFLEVVTGHLATSATATEIASERD